MQTQHFKYCLIIKPVSIEYNSEFKMTFQQSKINTRIQKKQYQLIRLQENMNQIKPKALNISYQSPSLKISNITGSNRKQIRENPFKKDDKREAIITDRHQRYISGNYKDKMNYMRNFSLLQHALPKDNQINQRGLSNNRFANHVNAKKRFIHNDLRQDVTPNKFSRQLYNNEDQSKRMLKIQEENTSPRKIYQSREDTNLLSCCETVDSIIQKYKQQFWQPFIPEHLKKDVKFCSSYKNIIEDNRKIILGILVNYHMTMKLPIEALFLAMHIFDEVFGKKLVSHLFQCQNQSIFTLENMTKLAITCLYVSHKLQKFRVYHIGSWVKHLTFQNVPMLRYALPSICIFRTTQQPSNQQEFIQWKQEDQRIQKQKQQLAKTMLQIEGQILSMLGFNVWRITLCEILVGIYTILNNVKLQNIANKSVLGKQKNWNYEENRINLFPNKHQLYFCMYLMELSLFCDFSVVKSDIKLIEIALGIIQLATYFFGENKKQGITFYDKILEILKILYQRSDISPHNGNSPQKIGQQQPNQQQNDQYFYEQKFKTIKLVSNILFTTLLADKPEHFAGIIKKYSKRFNLKVCQYKFKRKQKEQGNYRKYTDENNGSHISLNIIQAKENKNRMVSPRYAPGTSQLSNISSAEVDQMLYLGSEEQVK